MLPIKSPGASFDKGYLGHASLDLVHLSNDDDVRDISQYWRIAS